MKSRIHKKHHFSKREGFSLVEILITIAIMAILVGVVALAVIPQIGRSHESKDLTKLDNIASSVNIALANNRINENGQFEIGGTVPASGTASRKVYDAVKTELGDLTQIEMESGAAEGQGNIKVIWTIENDGAAKVTVQVGEGNVACKYTKGNPGDSDGFQYLRVSNE